MQLQKTTIKTWSTNFEYSLPGLLNVIQAQKSDTFLIGASLLDIYKTEGWITDFSRITRDLDFTIEYFGEANEYLSVCDRLKSLGYTKDDQHPYRYHPVKKQGVYAYVDFLTFTTNFSLEAKAKILMSVGELFNFEGMDFAKKDPLHFGGNIYLPNPLALIYLKMKSYYHNPERRKDFVDFLEVILRMSVEASNLHHLNNILSNCNQSHVLKDFKMMLYSIANDKGSPWDLDDIKLEMKNRKLLEEFEWAEIPATVEFFGQKVLPRSNI
ncbi:MAG: hypothetical protein ISR65_20485 [Bacteriovoracaceae bacterium]|nr:hypothetical protein [Bacteriovoracaceae bacterium]